MTIDACINRCVLFRKEFANVHKCPICLAPRWKEKLVQVVDKCSDNDNVRKIICVPQLVLHHFPLTPRLILLRFPPIPRNPHNNPARSLVCHVCQATQPSNILTQDLEDLFESLDTEEDPFYVKAVSED